MTWQPRRAATWSSPVIMPRLAREDCRAVAGQKSVGLEPGSSPDGECEEKSGNRPEELQASMQMTAVLRDRSADFERSWKLVSIRVGGAFGCQLAVGLLHVELLTEACRPSLCHEQAAHCLGPTREASFATFAQ